MCHTQTCNSRAVGYLPKLRRFGSTRKRERGKKRHIGREYMNAPGPMCGFEKEYQLPHAEVGALFKVSVKCKTLVLGGDRNGRVYVRIRVCLR